MRKPTKTISGVTPIAVVIKPRPCPHGTCIYCPSLNVPQSYTPKSPAIIRARNLSYDPKKQVFSRLSAFQAMKHPTDKIELIIMGGTFLAYPLTYQYQFILDCYNALNESESDTNSSNNLSLKDLKKHLAQAKKVNETAKHRCIALCLETRPDYCSENEIKRMMEFGCTRVELGVQMPSDILYKKTKRGHTVKQVIQATERLKNAGFKVGYHIMPGQPFSNLDNDLKLMKKLFSDDNFRPDQLKIYPCQVIKGSELENLYYQEKYKPYSEKELVTLITKFKQFIPKYTRIMRIMREIPPEFMVAGTKRIDLRKVIQEEMQKHGKKCRCIRCREIGFALRDKKFPKIDENLHLNIIKYRASHGTEYFLEIINDQDIIFGLIRLRIPDTLQKRVFSGRRKSKRFSSESKELLVRELHVYGQAVEIGKVDNKKTQHTGLGKWLMEEAETLAKKHKVRKIKVISGVGVREYYKNLGYELDKEGYMTKTKL